MRAHCEHIGQSLSKSLPGQRSHIKYNESFFALTHQSSGFHWFLDALSERREWTCA
jgi:hypothetical protein